jgi:putative membrane protein
MIPTLSEALADRGYDTLTDVQQAVTAPELAETDLLVSAQTGSGKTVGFGLAIAQTLMGGEERFSPPAAPLALVIAPTRELALQVQRELEWLYAKAGARVVSCIGGMDARDERRALDRGAHIVVGTPGRLRDHLTSLYKGRADLALGREDLARRRDEVFDAEALLELTETQLLKPLDAAAKLQIEAAARQVATVTALVPIAFADIITALTANIRMIRRIAEIYGGRSGTLGAWRLTRAVMTHLVATGAVAIGDDMIGSVAGGSVLSKVSRRFGEGVVNGALTARVGVAAMEVCRPMPFSKGARPSVSGLVSRALSGLFGRPS